MAQLNPETQGRSSGDTKDRTIERPPGVPRLGLGAMALVSVPQVGVLVARRTVQNEEDRSAAPSRVHRVLRS